MKKTILSWALAIAALAGCVAGGADGGAGGGAKPDTNAASQAVTAASVTVPITILPPRLVSDTGTDAIILVTDKSNHKAIQFTLTQVPVGGTITQISLRVKGDNSFGPNQLTGCFFALYEQADAVLLNVDFSIATQPPIFQPQTITMRQEFQPRVVQAGHMYFVNFYAGDGPGPCYLFAADVTYLPAP